jgi:hypothetical protein
VKGLKARMLRESVLFSLLVVLLRARWLCFFDLCLRPLCSFSASVELESAYELSA